MMPRAHTPGPWIVVKDGDHDRIETRIGSPIARVDNMRNAYKGNARLIAAAPDLLEALELALHFIETPGDFQPHERLEVIQDLNAALAKVRP